MFAGLLQQSMTMLHFCQFNTIKGLFVIIKLSIIKQFSMEIQMLYTNVLVVKTV